MAIPSEDGALRGTAGLERLRSPPSSFTFNRRARPPPMPLSTGTEDETRLSLKPSEIQRRESKGGLRGIFNRNKAEKLSTVSPVLEEGAPPSSFSDRSMRSLAEARLSRSMSIKRPLGVQPPTPVTPAKTPKQASRMNLRSKSVNTSKTPSKPSPKPSTITSSPNRPTRTSPAWDPLPLFQAYTQAIKHAQLSASTLSADSILRISNHKKENSLMDDVSQSRTTGDGQSQTAVAKKREKARIKHRRQISGSISKADWTHKIFVLVTSGYLLQYSGEGSFDRLPEKMMQLGKDSVAFASDVIPGKHWVLQVSQSMDAGGAPTADSRSLLSRLTFRGADYRRTATSLLLVLTSAEEMDSWLAVVRREIEALGGKKHISETGRPKPDENVTQLRAQPSHRQLVQRDPDQFSNPPTPLSSSFEPAPWARTNSLHTTIEDTASTLNMPQSTARPSTGHHSFANSVASHDGRQLEELRNSTNRFSYMSSGQRTIVTSQYSSPATSPTRDSTSSYFEDFTSKASVEDVRPRPNASAISERRRSMQAMQIPILEAAPPPPPPPKTFRHSAYGSGITVVTPNFSVPNYSNRRYSAMKTTTIEAPGISSPQTRSTEPALKGTRKAPPPAITVARPLSPVTDFPTPKSGILMSTPQTPTKMLQQIRASVIDIPPRSPLYTPSPTESNTPRRRSSLVPIASPELSNVDFRFPRRHSSMLAFRDGEESLSSPPERPAPILPTLPTKPLTRPHLIEAQEITTTTPPEPERLPVILNTRAKLHRPNSMQIRPATLFPPLSPPLTSKLGSPPISSVTQITHANRPVLNQGNKSPGLKPISPSLQRLRLDSNAKALANRRSMPLMVNGPPPAPPPDCALPPLPPPGVGVRGSKAGGLRSSVKV